MPTLQRRREEEMRLDSITAHHNKHGEPFGKTEVINGVPPNEVQKYTKLLRTLEKNKHFTRPTQNNNGTAVGTWNNKSFGKIHRETDEEKGTRTTIANRKS